MRNRKILQAPRNGGVGCSGVSLKEIVPCGALPEAPVVTDCLLSEWDSWTACSTACGGGQRSRSRYIMQEAQKGGKGCNQDLKVVEMCDDNPPCSDDVDCVWGEWEEW